MPAAGDLFGWCRRLTFDLFRRMLLDGVIKPMVTIEELEAATLCVIRGLGRVKGDTGGTPSVIFN